MGSGSGYTVSYYFVIREEIDGEAIGLFSWPTELGGVGGEYPYYLNPSEDDDVEDPQYWLDEINKAEFDTYRQIVRIPVKDVEQLQAVRLGGGTGGDVQITAGCGGCSGAGGAVQIQAGNGMAGNGAGGSIILIGGSGGV